MNNVSDPLLPGGVRGRGEVTPPPTRLYPELWPGWQSAN
jgi:hypothetical protein